MTPNRQRTIDTITAAALATAEMPTDEFGGWIAYFCDSLESQTDAPADVWIATAIQRLNERLITGAW